MKNKTAASAAGDTKYQGAPCKRGHGGIRYVVNADCVDCAMDRQNTEARKNYIAGYRKTSSTVQAYQKAYQKQYEQREVVKAKRATRRKANPELGAARTQKYNSAKNNRTPLWLGADELWMISQAYELAALRTKLFGFAWHVDHVIPLRGELVSGLHVPHNLQVIPAWDNKSKSNRFAVTS
jgi:hypothetical protein